MAYVFDQARINQLHQRWSTMRVTRQHTEIAFEAESIIHHRAIYEEAENSTENKIPWFFFGVVDAREGGIQELGKRNLANGDSLLWFTRQVPQGRPVIMLPNGHRKPPPFTWLEAAIDAVKHEGLDKVTDWTIEHILHLLEPYNGLGYYQLGHPSPYIWSCTTVYDPPNGPGGKYIRDHVYDPHAIDSQVGCAPLLAEIARQGNVIFTSHFSSPPVNTVRGMFGKITADAVVLPAQRRRLGKKAARPFAIKHWWSDIFNKTKLEASLGPIPAVFGHIDDTTPVPMLGNDRAGDCAWCTIAHLTMVRELAAGKPAAPFTDQSVLAEYSAATGYNPNDPSSDQGSDMQDVAAWWKATGIHDADGTAHKVDFFAFLKVGNLDELAEAAYYCGGVALGLNLPTSAEKQFDEHVPWTVDVHSKIAGGHAVALVGRNSAGNWVIATWDGLQAVTDEFIQTYMDEGFVGVSQEYLTAKGITPEGITEQQEEQAV